MPRSPTRRARLPSWRKSVMCRPLTPGRANAVFLPMAIQAGLTSAIMDARTPHVVTAVKGADLMKGNDEWGANWIAAHRAKQKAAEAAGG